MHEGQKPRPLHGKAGNGYPGRNTGDLLEFEAVAVFSISRKARTNVLSLGFALIILLTATAADAQSVIIVTNLDLTMRAQDLGTAGDTWAAGGFTTSSATELTSVTTVLFPTRSGVIELLVYTDNAGDPGTVIASVGTTAHGDSRIFEEFTFTASTPIALEAATNYWLVGRPTVAAGGAAAFTVADSLAQEGAATFIASYRQSFDAGGTWADFGSSVPLRFHIVPEPTSGSLCAAALLTVTALARARSRFGR